MAPGGHTIKAIEILPRIFGQGYSQPSFPEFRPAAMNFGLLGCRNLIQWLGWLS